MTADTPKPDSHTLGLMWLHLVLGHDESPDDAARKVHHTANEAWSVVLEALDDR